MTTPDYGAHTFACSRYMSTSARMNPYNIKTLKKKLNTANIVDEWKFSILILGIYVPNRFGFQHKVQF